MASWQQTLQNAQFETRYSPDTLILDVRTPEEYRMWHLDGSVNVPIGVPPDRRRMNIFIANLLRFSRRRGRPIIVYCRRGIRAGAMKEALENAGFHNVINLGGIETMPLAVMRQKGITKL